MGRWAAQEQPQPCHAAGSSSAGWILSRRHSGARRRRGREDGRSSTCRCHGAMARRPLKQRGGGTEQAFSSSKAAGQPVPRRCQTLSARQKRKGRSTDLPSKTTDQGAGVTAPTSSSLSPSSLLPSSWRPSSPLSLRLSSSPVKAPGASGRNCHDAASKRCLSSWHRHLAPISSATNRDSDTVDSRRHSS